MANKFNFAQVQRNLQVMKVQLPRLLANQAQNYFTASWRNQGWDGKKWEEVNRRIDGTKEYKYAKPAARTRAIMVKTGALRRATGNSIREATFQRVLLVVDLPYARIHNDGGKLGRGKGTMPQRQYIGQTKELTGKQTNLIKTQFRSIWQG